MLDWFILQLFLYFPEDKSEYIPAAFWMMLFLTFTILTFRWILKVSKKQEEKTKKIEEEVNRQRQQ
ncbi:hypothetical protein [Jeotgalibacillus proteolyticus]|uniref:Uncharacterized protein n=1 Tax=Jeotgalibacillus proteolyticus TaxID=2082395 RepID=A0A2S5GAP0_9BACL|nr:hypothetical protein [Jeotgalibacillus proteolyticus]PPA69991.1 hypothetical protein C4B60_10340 [Jeotgalibacillus proteolyticus]